VRQLGLIAGIDLIDAKSGGPLDWRLEIGATICRRARHYGLLTRPVRDTLVLMPPLCVISEQIREMVGALKAAVEDVLG
jgi:adenosylmethionine-8-amino-7-oxononanoate aminotransferase